MLLNKKLNTTLKRAESDLSKACLAGLTAVATRSVVPFNSQFRLMTKRYSPKKKILAGVSFKFRKLEPSNCVGTRYYRGTKNMRDNFKTKVSRGLHTGIKRRSSNACCCCCCCCDCVTKSFEVDISSV